MAAAFVCLAGRYCFGQSNKVQYELEERCGKQAQAMFDHDWKGGGS
jgi:hypothetical protein